MNLRPLPLVERVHQALQLAPMTRSQLARGLSVSEDAVRRALQELNAVPVGAEEKLCPHCGHRNPGRGVRYTLFF